MNRKLGLLLTNWMIACAPAIGEPDLIHGRVVAVGENAFWQHEGTLTCLTDCASGRPDQGFTYTVIDGDNANACAIRSSGAVRCWGYGGWGEDAPNIEATDIAVSAQIACALTPDGQPLCWGYGYEEPARPPVGEGPWAEIDGGASGMFCAQDTAGLVECWDARPLSSESLQRSTIPYALVRVGRRAACGASNSADLPGGYTVDCFMNGAGWAAPRWWVKDFDFGGGNECVLLVERKSGPEGELHCSPPVPEAEGLFEVVSISESIACVSRESEALCWGAGFTSPTFLDVPP